MNQSKNNLFALAYGELSQDAFFAWLFNFANPIYQNDHQTLHDCAVKLLQKWLNQDIIIEDIKIKTQETFYENKKRNSIDIVIIINSSICIIVESKTNSHLHSNQLNRYADYAKQKYKNFIGIYLKTGNESRAYQKNIHPFKTFNRQDLLNHFTPYKDKISNDIFIDFVEYLQDIESKTQKFSISNPSEWKSRQWQGFYQYLDNLNLLTWWGMVNNPTHSFLVADFNKKEWQSHNKMSYTIVFAIHEQQLIFGIYDKSHKSAKIRNEFSKYLLSQAKDKFPEIKKPQKFGKGSFMKVAVINNYWLDENEQYIGMNNLVEKLKNYHNFLLSL